MTDRGPEPACCPFERTPPCGFCVSQSWAVTVPGRIDADCESARKIVR
jgi:hypothetical protein